MAHATDDETIRPVGAADPANETQEQPAIEGEEPAILAEVIVDDLSIDGMCGVY
jgi:mycofactocin precursor